MEQSEAFVFSELKAGADHIDALFTSEAEIEQLARIDGYMVLPAFTGCTPGTGKKTPC